MKPSRSFLFSKRPRVRNTKDKFEYRNPKFETISNDRKTQILNIVSSELGFGFSEFWICWIRFVSDFVLRISNFEVTFTVPMNLHLGALPRGE
jgi:hypothetical protein